MSPQTGEPARGSCFLQRIACLGRVILVLSPGLRPQLIFFDCFGCTWPIYLKEVYLFVFMCVFRSFWLLWLLAFVASVAFVVFVSFVASVAFGFRGFWLWWFSWLLWLLLFFVAFGFLGFRGFWLSWLPWFLQAAHLWIWCAAGGGVAPSVTPPRRHEIFIISGTRGCHEIIISR